MHVTFLQGVPVSCDLAVSNQLQNSMSKRYRKFTWSIPILAATIGTLLCNTAIAEDNNGVRFEIRDYVIAGAGQVSAERLHAAVAPYKGTSETFSSIQKAAAALQRIYADEGYTATQIGIPQQDITSGIVHLKVLEARIGTVAVIGNKHFDATNIRAALPLLREGQTPKVDAIGASVRLANESYARQMQVTFRQADQAETVDATIRVTDLDPVRHVLSMDNTGTSQTGRYRLGYAFQHANLFNTDHTFTAQYVTSPEHIKDVTILGLNYRIPFYTLGSAIDFSASHANVDSGTVPTTSGSYAISGSGNLFGIRYTQLLPRFRQWNQRVTTAYHSRHYQNKVMANGSSASLVPDLTSQPLTLGYAGSANDAHSEWRADVSYSRNLPGGGKNSSAAYQAPGGRSGATADFGVWHYSANLQQSLPSDWQAQLQFAGQYTTDALIPGEQFGIGGAASVRGFDEREILDDRGYRASVEVQGPDFGKTLGGEDLHVRLAVFYDRGQARRNHALAGERTSIDIASAGLGARIALGSRGQVRLDYASILQGGGVRRNGDHKIHANFTLLF